MEFPRADGDEFKMRMDLFIRERSECERESIIHIEYTLLPPVFAAVQ
jgi:hypothetical protein